MKADKQIDPILRNTRTTEIKANKKRFDFQKESASFKCHSKTKKKDHNH